MNNEIKGVGEGYITEIFRPALINKASGHSMHQKDDKDILLKIFMLINFNSRKLRLRVLLK